MHRHLETLVDLEEGQKVRMSFADESTHPLKVVHQRSDPDEEVSVELVSEAPDDGCRYVAQARRDGGGWTDLRVNRYDPRSREWRVLAWVTVIDPVETYQIAE